MYNRVKQDLQLRWWPAADDITTRSINSQSSDQAGPDRYLLKNPGRAESYQSVITRKRKKREFPCVHTVWPPPSCCIDMTCFDRQGGRAATRQNYVSWVRAKGAARWVRGCVVCTTKSQQTSCDLVLDETDSQTVGPWADGSGVQLID